MSGRVFGLGVGSGVPELITLKALARPRAAPVVADPAPETGASFARLIVARWLPPAQIELPIRIPLDGSASRPARSMTWRRWRSPGISMPGATSPCCARAIRSSMAPSCIFSRVSPSALWSRWSQASPRSVRSPQSCAGHSRRTSKRWLSYYRRCSRTRRLPRASPPPKPPPSSRSVATSPACAISWRGWGSQTMPATFAHASLASERVLLLDQVAAEDVPYFSMILLRRNGELVW